MRKLIFINPHNLIPPHRVTRPEQVEQLAEIFRKDGWDYRYPSLVGYQIAENIQLLSGSHRVAAAKLAGLSAIPVMLHPEEVVYACWGDLPAWRNLMRSGG